MKMFKEQAKILGQSKCRRFVLGDAETIARWAAREGISAPKLYRGPDGGLRGSVEIDPRVFGDDTTKVERVASMLETVYGEHK